MALVTIQRSPSASSSPPSSEYGSSIYSLDEEPYHNRSLSEYYFAVKGFAVLLPKNECQQGRRKKSAVPPADIQAHLQSILHLHRPGDTLQMAVRLESFHSGRIRYLVVVATIGKQDVEESCLIGVDFSDNVPKIGLVLSVLADTHINLDGDGGFSVSSAGRNHIFKPISVQAMWSALQAVHKSSGKARDHHFYQGGLNHDWVGYYEKNISSDQSCINEWNAMANLESRRPPSPDSLTNKEETELLIRSKLKEIMTSVDIDEVTSKYIRQRLEEDLAMDLFKYKSFIDQEMLIILGQMDAATEIFPHVYLGSEWNASNLEELKVNQVGFILNVTKEIDNFFPGMFDYLNIRVYDDEKTELLRHWDDTYKYISLVREKGSKVLVHCKMGISRSASVVIAYAMKAYKLSFDEATDLVRKKRSCIKPNQAFTTQLKIYQGILDASRQRHNALFRSKSETNLKTTPFIPINRYTQRSFHTTTPAVDESSKDSSSNVSGHHKLTIPEFKRKCASTNNNTTSDRSDTASEEFDSTIFGSNDRCLLSVTPIQQSQRPKSWSPDEESASYLSLNNYEEPDYGEGMQKCYSLNDQVWHAHVKVEQRDLRDPGGGLVEAINPIFLPRTVPSSPSSTPSIDVLQLTSTVKDRINEFESVQSSKPIVKSPSSTLLANKQSTTSSLNDTIIITNTCDSSSTDELIDFQDIDLTVKNLQTPPLQIDGFDAITCKISANRQQAPCISPGLEQSDLSDTPYSEPNDPAVVLTNESISWPAGIVKRQTEDFEEKVRNLDSLSKKLSNKSKDGEWLQPSLSRQASSHSLGATEEDNLRRDDPFSACVDCVFDREETKEKKGMRKDNSETPSRNNSWGSFDSAVILPDRDAPSRQSSWGSCDTRISAGSILSRNSSLGTFDLKTGWLGHRDYLPQPNSSPPIAYFDKDAPPLNISPSTIRRNKINAKLGSAFPLGEQENLQPKSSAMVKAFGPIPYRNIADMEPCSAQEIDSSADFFLPSSPPIISQIVQCNEISRLKPDNSRTDCIASWPPLSSNVNSKYYETMVPGFVEQTRRKLESKAEFIGELGSSQNNLYSTSSAPAIGRSLSSGCMSTFAGTECKVNPITRSASEKRAKSVTHSPALSVKKIMSTLEKPTLGSCDTVFEGVLKPGPFDFFGRSHSLERLGDATSKLNNKVTSFPQIQTCDRSESQTFLDRLVVETEAQVNQLEKDQEEIKVKNLVDMFEVSRSSSCKNIGVTVSPPSLQKSVIVLRKIRPRSESMGDKELPPIPPVPQRKSSLDHGLRITAPNSPNRRSFNIECLRQSVSTNNSNASINSFTISNGINKPPSINPPKPPPPPPSNRTCGTEVRRRKKQQGKTHPLSKLTPRENTL